MHQNQRRKIKGDDEVEYADTFNHSNSRADIDSGDSDQHQAHERRRRLLRRSQRKADQEKKISGPVLREVTVHIDGMHCQNCRVRIENHLNEMDGIVAKVNLNKKTAAISIYKDIDDLEIQNTIEKLGYTVVSME